MRGVKKGGKVPPPPAMRKLPVIQAVVEPVEAKSEQGLEEKVKEKVEGKVHEKVRGETVVGDGDGTHAERNNSLEAGDSLITVEEQPATTTEQQQMVAPAVKKLLPGGQANSKGLVAVRTVQVARPPPAMNALQMRLNSLVTARAKLQQEEEEEEEEEEGEVGQFQGSSDGFDGGGQQQLGQAMIDAIEESKEEYYKSNKPSKESLAQGEEDIARVGGESAEVQVYGENVVQVNQMKTETSQNSQTLVVAVSRSEPRLDQQQQQKGLKQGQQQGNHQQGPQQQQQTFPSPDPSYLHTDAITGLLQQFNLMKQSYESSCTALQAMTRTNQAEQAEQLAKISELLARIAAKDELIRLKSLRKAVGSS